MNNSNYSTLTSAQLTNINGGRRHRVHWGRCALGVATGEGLGALEGGYIGAAIGGVSGAVHTC